MKRMWDFAVVQSRDKIDAKIVAYAAERLEIDNFGLDKIDRTILKTVGERYKGGPVGLDTLSASIGEDKQTIESVYEPYLVYRGLISRSPRGRVLTPEGRNYLS